MGGCQDILLEFPRRHSYGDVIVARERLGALLDCPADILSAPLAAMPACVRETVESERVLIYDAG